MSRRNRTPSRRSGALAGGSRAGRGLPRCAIQPAVRGSGGSAGPASPLGFKDRVHVRVAPPVTQQERVPQPPFVFQAELPKDGGGGDVTGIAGREDAVERVIPKGPLKKPATNPGGIAAPPVLGVYDVADLSLAMCAAVNAQLPSADHSVREVLGEPDESRPLGCRDLAGRNCVDDEGLRCRGRVRAPRLVAADVLTDAPLVYSRPVRVARLPKQQRVVHDIG
jgi:hypothetical protein